MVAPSNFHGNTVLIRRARKLRPHSPFFATSPSESTRLRERLRRGRDPRPEVRCTSSSSSASPPTVTNRRLTDNSRRASSGGGISTAFPFAFAGSRPTSSTVVAGSGTPHPAPIVVVPETFSTSALRALTEVEATFTTICTGGGSTRSPDRASAPPPRLPTRRPIRPNAIGERTPGRRLRVGRSLQRHPLSRPGD